MYIAKCCLEQLYGSDRCSHRQRYLDAEAYIISRNIRIDHPDYDWWDWKGGRSGKYAYDRYIETSSIAYKIYGWDVMTSVLVHEFGHCDLFNEGIGEGSSPAEQLEIEKKANARGREIMPPNLVPEDYREHRAFFLRSYEEDGWSREKCLDEWSKIAVFQSGSQNRAC